MAQTSPAAPAPSAAATALTPASAAELLRRDRVLSGTLPLQGWLAALQPLADRDKSGDRTRTWLGGLAIGVGILTFVLLIAEALPFAAAGAAADLGLVIAYFMKRRADLANHLREFVVPLLRVLRQDTTADTPVELSLRLRDRFDRANRTQKIGGVEHFSYPWLSGRTRLFDGATLDFEVADEARRWSVTKRGRSGKTKTKTKYALRTDIVVRLGAPKDAYEPQGRPATAPTDSIQIKTTEKRHVVTAQRSLKRKGLAGLDLGLRDFLGVVALCYGALAPIAKSKKGDK